MPLIWQPTFGAGSGLYARTPEGIELYVRRDGDGAGARVKRGMWAAYVGGILVAEATSAADAKDRAVKMARLAVIRAKASAEAAAAGNSKSAAKTAAMRS